MSDAMDLSLMGRQCRKNSERWFPAIHDPQKQAMPIDIHYTLALAGEIGELANLVKKMYRYTGANIEDIYQQLPSELADIFTYLILLADEWHIDLLEAFEQKQFVCEQRWGQ